MSESSTRKIILESDEVVLGGTELHVQFAGHVGDPGIVLEFTPPFAAEGDPEGIEDINGRIAGLCRTNLLDMEDSARFRLLSLVERDGGKDRMLYRLLVVARTDDDGSHQTRVIDEIDPEFTKVDEGITARALECRKALENVLSGGTPPHPGSTPARSLRELHWQKRDQQRKRSSRARTAQEPEAPESEEVFEILGTTEHHPAAGDLSEEEAQAGLLAGEEFMILEIQVVGIVTHEHCRDMLMFDYTAAISPKAVSSPWMKEKIRNFSRICENTIMVLDKQTIRYLTLAIQETKEKEKCIYRISAWVSLGEDGSWLYSIRDSIDPVFLKQDPSVEKRAEEARRLAGREMEGEVRGEG